MATDPECLCNPTFKDGVHFNTFIAQVFMTCVYSNRDIWAFFFAMCNLACWLFFIHAPQFIKTAQIGRSAAISPIMLACWLGGDFFGIVGLILSGAGGTALVTQLYYSFADLALLLQHFYYQKWPRPDPVHVAPIEGEDYVIQSNDNNKNIELQHFGSNLNDLKQSNRNIIQQTTIKSSYTTTYTTKHDPHLISQTGEITTCHDDEQKDDNVDPFANNQNLHVSASDLGSHRVQQQQQQQRSTQHVSTISTTHIAVVCALAFVSMLPMADAQTAVSFTQLHTLVTFGRKFTQEATATICVVTELSATRSALSTICSWLCTACYCPSKLPQIYHNWKRKSTQGISLMFIYVSLVSYFFYLGGVLVSQHNYDVYDGFTSASFWKQLFPFVFTAIVSIFTTGFIAYQMWLYKDNIPIDDAVDNTQYAVYNDAEQENTDTLFMGDNNNNNNNTSGFAPAERQHQ